MLPSNYLAIVTEGADALRWAAATLTATGGDDRSSRAVLALRDVTSLAGRLGDIDAEDWISGSALAYLSPADLAVLETWEEITYEDSARQELTAEGNTRHQQFQRLRFFLEEYLAA